MFLWEWLAADSGPTGGLRAGGEGRLRLCFCGNGWLLIRVQPEGYVLEVRGGCRRLSFLLSVLWLVQLVCAGCWLRGC